MIIIVDNKIKLQYNFIERGVNEMDGIERKQKKKLTSRDLQAEERRKQFLEAAKELFAKNGFHGTPIRSINRAVGMTEGLMYYYFPGGKHEILQVIIQEAIEEKKNNMFTVLSQITPDLSAEESLKQLGQMVFDYATRDQSLLIILFRDKELINEENIEAIQEVAQALIERIASIMRQLSQREEFEEFDPLMMGNQFFGPLSSYIIQEIVFNITESGFRPDPDTYLQKVIDHTLKTWRKKG